MLIGNLDVDSDLVGSDGSGVRGSSPSHTALLSGTSFEELTGSETVGFAVSDGVEIGDAKGSFRFVHGPRSSNGAATWLEGKKPRGVGRGGSGVCIILGILRNFALHIGVLSVVDLSVVVPTISKFVTASGISTSSVDASIIIPTSSGAASRVSVVALSASESNVESNLGLE